MSDEAVGVLIVLGIQGFALFMLSQVSSDGWMMFYLFVLFAPLVLGFFGLVFAHDAYNNGNDAMEQRHQEDFENGRNIPSPNFQNNHYESLYNRYKS